MSVCSAWPDPNAPVLAKISFGVRVADLLQWLEVRDTLLGSNFVACDIEEALELSRGCCHPDAVWLNNVCKERNVSSKKHAKKVFLEHQDNSNSLCFAWYLTEDKSDLSLLRKSADLGNALAAATLGFEARGQESFDFTLRAVSQNERDGFLWLGYCYEHGKGCRKDFGKAKENYLLAGSLGQTDAANLYARLLDECDASRWLWLGRAASRGCSTGFLRSFSIQVQQVVSGFGNPAAVFAIGRALKGHVEEESIFGTVLGVSPEMLSNASRAVIFYESQIKCARLGVDTWTFVAIRLKMIKVVRVLIGKLLWDARSEANYDVTRMLMDDKE